VNRTPNTYMKKTTLLLSLLLTASLIYAQENGEKVFFPTEERTTEVGLNVTSVVSSFVGSNNGSIDPIDFPLVVKLAKNNKAWRFGLGLEFKSQKDDGVTIFGRTTKSSTVFTKFGREWRHLVAKRVVAYYGFKGKVTPRNSMTIVNPIMNNNLFWDSRASSIRGLVLEPVQNHIEMGMESINKLSVKLSETSFYPELFQKAYGTEEVTEEGIADALMQFLMSMMSYKSKWDVGVEQNFENFDALETMGRGLFFSQRTQCSGCHSGVNFSAPDGFGNLDIRLLGNSTGDLIFTNQFGDISSLGGGEYFETQGTANIGLDVVYADQGRGDGNFKIPSLRNIGLTAPYMHDGRFNTLEEVINHYDQNLQPHTDLDTKFKSSNGIPKRMDLSQLEKRALEAFFIQRTIFLPSY
ncbi:MAG: cytochrome-c peroxidase, partial [Chitinophagales bacterium]